MPSFLKISGRVEKSVKNSTDTIFELEILAQKARAKMSKNVQKCVKMCKMCKNPTNGAKMRKIVQKV